MEAAVTDLGSKSVTLQWDALFAVSSGVVSSYGPSGELNWQLHDAPTWGEGNRGWLLRLPPALSSQAARLGSGLQAGPGGGSDLHSQEVLVVGDESLMVVGATFGEVLCDAPVPQPPRRKPILGDFDDDGAAEVKRQLPFFDSLPLSPSPSLFLLYYPPPPFFI